MSPTAGGRAFQALLLGAVCIGLSGVFVKLSEVGPQASAFYRIGLSAPIFWFWLAWTPVRESNRVLDRHERRLLILAGLVVFGDYASWHVSLKLTSVANSTLLANLVPIFVALYATIFLRRPPRTAFLGAMAITLAGAALLLHGSLSLSLDRAMGDGLAVITAMFYAAYVILIARLRETMSTARLMAWTGTIAGPLFLVFALATGETIIPATAQGWLVVLGLVLLCQVLGSGLIAYALAHLPATFSSLTLLLQPVFSSLAAWVILGERLGVIELAGGSLVLIGVYLARRTS